MAVFVLAPTETAEIWQRAWVFAQSILRCGKHVRVSVDEVSKSRKRTLEQNDALNATCQDISKQVKWIVNGESVYMDENDWRHIFVAAYRKSARVVPGIDGGYVVLGASSKELGVGECSDVIEIAIAFGNEKGVRWAKRHNAP